MHQYFMFKKEEGLSNGVDLPPVYFLCPSDRA